MVGEFQLDAGPVAIRTADAEWVAVDLRKDELTALEVAILELSSKVPILPDRRRHRRYLHWPSLFSSLPDLPYRLLLRREFAR